MPPSAAPFIFLFTVASNRQILQLFTVFVFSLGGKLQIIFIKVTNGYKMRKTLDLYQFYDRILLIIYSLSVCIRYTNLYNLRAKYTSMIAGFIVE